MTKNTRRSLLKAVGAGMTLEFAGFASAKKRSVADVQEDEIDTAELQIPYDIRVRNAHNEETEVTMSFSLVDSEESVFTKTSRIGARDSTSAVIDYADPYVPKGEYVVRFTTPGGGSETTEWLVSADGIPSWRALSVVILPDNSIEIYPEEV
jgi:hypothetical protein